MRVNHPELSNLQDVPAATTPIAWRRRLLAAALMLGSLGLAGMAHADGEQAPPPEEEAPAEPAEPTPADERTGWDWILWIMGDEGGSIDPETGTG